jgi:hypothetical protein
MKAYSGIETSEDGYFRYQCVSLTDEEQEAFYSGKLHIPFPLPFEPTDDLSKDQK